MNNSNSAKLIKQREYWIGKLTNEFTPIELPYIKNNNDKEFIKEKVSFNIPEDITSKILKICKNSDVSLYVFLTSTVKCLIYRYSGKNDIGIGAPVYRDDSEQELKNNIILIRSEVMNNMTFKELLLQTRKDVLEAFSNQDYPFDDLKNYVNHLNNYTKNQLKVICSLDNIQNFKDVEELKNSLIFRFKKDGEVISGDIYICVNDIDRNLIERYATHYINILKNVLENIEIGILDFEIIFEDEKKFLLDQVNNTSMDLPEEKTIIEVFHKQVEMSSNKLAVIFEDSKLSYEELNKNANQLAEVLINRGVKPRSVVGLMTDRSTDMIVAMIAVLKVGASYMAIDPEFPENRITFMVEDAKVHTIIGQKKYENILEKFLNVIIVDKDENYVGEGENLDIKVNSEEIAYTIYTSGTTGNPKGIQIKNSSVVNLCEWYNKQYNLKENNRVLQTSNYIFDPSVEQIFGTLLNGGTLYCIDKNKLLEKNKFSEFLTVNKINIINFTPSYIKELLVYDEKVESVNIIICGGEKLTDSLKDQIMQLGYRLYNHYGPTETTVDALTSECTLNKPVTIGKPIGNTKAYVLNENSQLQPVGVKGELCISGAGVSLGYLNDIELTRKRFVKNPFNDSEIIYRTGDLARVSNEGTFEYLGRIDNQVKIRGFRIELGEIESELRLVEVIKDAVVVCKDDKSDQAQIVAYIVLKNDTDDDMETVIKGSLSKRLPYYMMPSKLIFLEKIPLFPTGKVDIKKLKELVDSKSNRKLVVPRNQIEKKLVELWREILGIQDIGIDDCFFEIGGHSLKSTKLVSKIYKEFDVEISLVEIFNITTIREIAVLIEQRDKHKYTKIKKQDDNESYPASSAQKRLFFINQLDEDSTVYNMPFIFRIKGRIDKTSIEGALNTLVKRHESLRTTFDMEYGIVRQFVHENIDENIQYFDATEEEIHNVIDKFIKPFNLKELPLWRVGIVSTSIEDHIFMLDMHHIISDGTSIQIFINDFARIYQEEELQPLTLQYRDFAVWQNELLESDEINKQREFWMNVFEKEVKPLDLPTDYLRPAMQSFVGEVIRFDFGEALTKELRSFADETGTTTYMILLAVINILLSKYSGQDDIVIGSPIAGRRQVEVENIMGMFVNTLAMRNKPEKNKTFREFLGEVKQHALMAFDNQEYQFEALVDNLKIERVLGRNSLFDVMFVMNNTETHNDILSNVIDSQVRVGDLIFMPLDYEQKTTHFDINFQAFDNGDNISFVLEYCTELFKRDTIERMINHFKYLTHCALSTPNEKILNLNIVLENEIEMILNNFNNTCMEYPGMMTVYEYFENKVEQYPDKIAVVYGDDKITYNELNKKANRLARLLKSKGIGKDSIVALLMKRSIDIVVGILGIMKAGGAYLPIDHKNPAERIKAILKDAQMPVILTSDKDKNLEVLGRYDNDIIVIEEIEDYLSQFSELNLEEKSNPEDLVYIIYTSGSTGEPKGVMLEHKNVMNLIHYEITQNLTEFSNKVLQFSTIAFDMSFNEIFSALMAGSELHIVDDESKLDINKVFEYIGKNQIETVFFPTAYLRFIINEKQYLDKFPRCIKYVLPAGEQLEINNSFSEYIKKSDLYVYNQYGPSETHVVTEYLVNCENSVPGNVPIGKPVANTQIYILNDDMQIQPIGVIGEIYIAGENVGRGYLNNEKLTKEKFIDDFINKGKKMYKTGDVGKWLPDGNICFLGRKDNQIKIRGFRVELGEIEFTLKGHKHIKDAVVLDKKDDMGNNYLCAYISTKKKISINEIREYLTETLAEYMIPANFIEVEKMPLTTTGKIDTKVLRHLELLKTSNNISLNQVSEIEKKLISIWERILKIEGINIEDEFFLMGGNSLNALQVRDMIQKEFEVEIPLSTLFKKTVLKNLAATIKELKRKNFTPIPKQEEQEYYPASLAQQMLFVLDKIVETRTAYNLTTAMKIYGEIDLEKFRGTFLKLIHRHEILRTSFTTIEGKVIQKISKNPLLEIDYIDENELDESEVINSFIQKFDFTKAPLIRVKLVKMGYESYLFLVDMPHIVSDGISMNILIKEFSELYNGNALEENKIQYKDYAVWQNKRFDGESMEKQKAYWIKEFSGELPVLNLPTDYNWPAVQDYKGDNFYFEIDKELRNDLMKVAERNGVTMYMLLLAAYNVLLFKYTQQEDCIIGTPIYGRTHPDLENLVGVFINTIAMRNYPSGEKKFSEFLNEVVAKALDAYENQDYPIEKVIENLNTDRDVSRSPLFDTMFSLENYRRETADLGSIKLEPVKVNAGISRYALSLNGFSTNYGMYFQIEYAISLFKCETIKRLAKHFENILREISKNEHVKISDIDMMCEYEKVEILRDFNITNKAYDKSKLIHELFEEQVIKTPEKIALICENDRITYDQLNRRANKIARYLIDKGVSSQMVVGIIMNRSVHMISAILGVLKAGGTYLPINISYPESRISFILKDSGVKFVLMQNRYWDKKVIDVDCIDVNNENIDIYDGENLGRLVNEDDLAYVIYTSGSTGMPKGVTVSHRAVNNFIIGITDKIHFTQEKTMLSLTTIAFDIFVLETILPLSKGLSIVIANEEEQRDPKLIKKLIIDENVDMMQITPSRLQLLINDEKGIEYLQNLSELLIGGEALSQNIVNQLHLIKTKIYNMYGPTETTVWSTFSEVIPNRKVTIGKPICNTEIYILDNQLNIVPIGVPGEIFIAGDGLSKGYLNRSDLTEEKFINNKFKNGAKMYRTGDLGRWLPNGEIDYIERIDDEVKIRGYRIELNEIKYHLMKHDAIKDVLVIAKLSETGEKYLVVYYVSDEPLNVSEVMEYLNSQLPEYMVPNIYIRIEEIPLNQNGKVDSKMLPEQSGDRPILERHYTEATTEVELALVEIWRNLLKISQVGVKDNFFELGGNSLLLVQMDEKINELYPNKVTIAEIFMSKTIENISKLITSTDILNEIAIETYELPNEYLVENGEENEDIEFAVVLEDNMHNDLKKLSKQYEVELADILLGIYIYQISELAERSSICMPIMVGEEDKVILPEFNFSQLENFADIFNQVSKKVNDENIPSYSQDEISKKIMIKKNEEFVPAISINSQLNTFNKDIIDIMLEIETGKSIKIVCNYNAEKIKKIKILDMVNEYIEILNELILSEEERKS